MTKSIGINKISLKKVFAFSLTLALTFGFTTNLGVLGSSAANRNSEKVTICHRTSAVTNPYRMITVSVNSIVSNNGHDNTVHNHEIPVSQTVTGTSGSPTLTIASPTTTWVVGMIVASNEAGFPSGTSIVSISPNTPTGSTTVTISQNLTSNVNSRSVDFITNPGVFDPTRTYIANQKKWEDIIPSFFYTQGTRKFFPGRNWTTEGKAIFYGLGDKAGLCGKAGAKEYADAEFESWLSDNPSSNTTQRQNKKDDIMTELKAMGANEDGDLTGKSNFDELPAEPKKPKGPNRPPAYDALIQSIVTQNSNVDPVANPAATLKQALAGVVWKDMNNNGIQDAGEEVFGNLPIQIIDPVTNLPVTLSQISLMSQLSTSVPNSQPLFSFAGLAGDKTMFSAVSNVVTLYTDANGYFEIPSLPEGDWTVKVITPEGWSYTYDSSGSSDGQMPETYVPAGGAGFAWAGLVFVGTSAGTTPGTTAGNTPGTTSGTAAKTSGLATTGNELAWMNDAIVGLVAIGGAFVLMGRGRREEQVEELGTKDY